MVLDTLLGMDLNDIKRVAYAYGLVFIIEASSRRMLEERAAVAITEVQT